MLLMLKLISWFHSVFREIITIGLLHPLNGVSKPYFSLESQIGILWAAHYKPFGKPSNGIVAESRTLCYCIDLMPDFKVDLKVLDGLITLNFFFYDC